MAIVFKRDETQHRDKRIAKLEQEYAKLMTSKTPNVARLADIVSELGRLWNAKVRDEEDVVLAPAADTVQLEEPSREIAPHQPAEAAAQEVIKAKPQAKTETVDNRHNGTAAKTCRDIDMEQLQKAASEIVGDRKMKMAAARNRDEVQDIFIDGLNKLICLLEDE